jgi:cysteine desulfurase
MSPHQGTSPPIYLDHAATTPLDAAVLEAMLPYLQSQFGNPSSLHRWGREANKALSLARQMIAQCLGAANADSFNFTGSATEADNLAILGLADALKDKGRHIVTTAIEHAAIENACQHLEQRGWDITRLPVDEEGFVSLDTLGNALRSDTVLVSIIHGNNEIGTLQPIESFGALLKERLIAFHVDAVQTVGKLPFDLKNLPVDYLSLSGHKLYGPKGIGALYIRPGATLPTAQIWGGGQENNLRSSTENLAAIVGLAKALEIATEQLSTETPRLRAMQERFIRNVQAHIPAAILNGPENVRQRVPGNVHFSFPPAEGEAIVRHLDLQGVAVASGSACHSAVVEPSRIVLALGKSEIIARSTVRFSFGRNTTQNELSQVIPILSKVMNRFQPKIKNS